MGHWLLPLFIPYFREHVAAESRHFDMPRPRYSHSHWRRLTFVDVSTPPPPRLAEARQVALLLLRRAFGHDFSTPPTTPQFVSRRIDAMHFQHARNAY